MKRSKESRLPALSLSNGLACFLANVMAVVVFLLTPPALIAYIGPDIGHVWSDRAKVIQVPSSDSCSPCFTKEMIIDPCRLKEGEEQYFSVWIRDPDPEGGVETVTVSIKVEGGITVFHLKLVEGTKEEGRWMGSWVARGISRRSYYFAQIRFITKKAQIRDRNLFLCPILETPPLNPEWMYFGPENSPLLSQLVKALAIDPWQNIWIGTWQGGLTKFDGTNWRVYTTSNSGLPDDRVTALAVDSKGDIWIGTADGLAKFDGTNWTVYNNPGNSKLSANYIYSLALDSKDNIWIGTYDGIVKFDGVNWTVYNTEEYGIRGRVWVHTIDSQGDIWIATGIFLEHGFEGGLAKFDRENWVAYNKDNSGLPDNYIYSLAIDRQDNLWIGTGEEGLVKFDGTNWTIYNELKDESGVPCSVSAISIDSQDNVWLGIPRCGIDEKVFLKFDGVKCETLENRVLVSNIVTSIVIDAQGNKWIGQNNGMSGGLTVYREGGVILNDPVVAVEERDNTKPSAFTLSQNYPNPFNPTTQISFDLPKNSQVTLTVFNALGQKIATLADEKRGAGSYRVTWDGTNFPSGVYFYRLETEGFAKTMKMLLMK